MDIRFDDKNVIVTGASTGIGRATAIEFARSGANVTVNYFHSEQAAKQVADIIKSEGGKAITIKADVAKAEQVFQLVRKSQEQFGETIDVLVNNAGSLLERKPLMEIDEGLWDQCMDLNMKSVLLCCQAVLPAMKAKGYGRIINITSISARNGGGPGAIHYSVAKSGLMAFSKGLAKELAGSGITVNNVAPGVITTPFHDKFTPDEVRANYKNVIPLGREGTSEEIAYSILFMASDYAAYITGETLEVNGGLLMD